jgi:FixJ family two-component response regulator
MNVHTSDAHITISVAIVDDDASVRVGLLRLCAAFGLQASVYASGPEFLASLADGVAPADCLLLDAHMPEMTGAELQRHLLAQGFSIPTIFFTADDAPMAHLQADTGTVMYLRKPVSGERLFATIADAVQAGKATP